MLMLVQTSGREKQSSKFNPIYDAAFEYIPVICSGPEEKKNPLPGVFIIYTDM